MQNKDYLPLVIKDILEEDKEISPENLSRNLKIYYDYLESKEKIKNQENTSKRKMVATITICSGFLIIVLSLFICFCPKYENNTKIISAITTTSIEEKNGN